METTAEIMKGKLEQLDLKVLECTSKAFEHYFDSGFVGFVQGLDKHAYIEYVVSVILKIPEEKTNELGVLGAFDEAVKMAKEQAGYSCIC